MYPAHRLDISFGDLAFALGACARERNADASAARLERTWSAHAIACLSVRSAFDLLLAACKFPKGSEIVFSAINVADMPRVAAAHGLVVVPADVERATLAPSPSSVERALSPRTRAIVVAQLFGSRVDLAPIADIARRRGILLVEDAAQALGDPRDTGDASADVSLFSFGSIKTATALGGALARVRDIATLERMRDAQRAWPLQSTAAYAKKIVKYAALLAASSEATYELFARGCALAGRDLDDVTRSTLRGFPGAELLPQIRQRPCAALLATIERRLARFDRDRLARRAARALAIVRALPPGIAHAGGDLGSHTHWVLTARAADPDAVVSALRREGFHATRRGASLDVVAPPPDRPELHPLVARDVLASLVFLPAYPEMPEPDVARMIAALPARAPSPSGTSVEASPDG